MKTITILASVQDDSQIRDAIENISGISDGVSPEVLYLGAGSIFDEPHFEGVLQHFFGLGEASGEKKKLVLAQLSVVNTIITLGPSAENPGALFQTAIRLAEKLGAVILFDDMTLMDRTGAIILYADGRAGDAGFTPQAAEKMVIGTPPESEEGAARKAANIEKLRAQGIRTIDHLPQLPPAGALRLKSERAVAERAATVLIIIQFACDIAYQQMETEATRKATIDNLHTYGLLDSLTEREKAFLFSETPGMDEATDLVWQYEAYWVLIWALGQVHDDLYFPDIICNCDAAMAAVFSCETFDEFLDGCQLRDISGILDEADLNYRYAWACTQARIDGEAPAADMNPSIVIERKRAFDWLLGLEETDWDYPAGGIGSLPVTGEVHLEGVSQCSFSAHETILDDDAYCFYGYQTDEGARLDLWGEDAAFYASVSPKGTPVILRSGELETSRTLSQLEKAEETLEECIAVLKKLQNQLQPAPDAASNLELQKYYDAKGLFEQIQAFAAIRARPDLDHAAQCEQLVPVFAAMTEIVKDAAASMPEEHRREDNAWGMTLMRLYAVAAGTRGMVEKEGLSLSGAFTQAAYNLQLAVEEAYEELAETEEYLLSEEEEKEIDVLMTQMSDPAATFDDRVTAARHLWEDGRLSVNERIDCVDAIIDLANNRLSEAESESGQLSRTLDTIQNQQWDNPAPALADIGRRLAALTGLQGVLASHVANITGASKAEVMLHFHPEAVSVSLVEDSSGDRFDGNLVLVLAGRSGGMEGKKIRAVINHDSVSDISFLN